METNKNKSAYVWLLVLVVLAFFAYAMWRPSSTTKTATELDDTVTQPAVTNEDNTMTSPTTTPSSTAPTAMTPTDEVMTGTKEFTVNASNFTFDIKELKVKKGDTVKLTLNNKEGFHDWRLDEFNANTKVLKAGETETITFVVNKTGTFEYYCSVGQHRAMGMKGNLIVE
jgi:VCBS repeat-containing protein